MLRGLYDSASALLALQQDNALVANDLANAATPGFLSAGATFASAFDSVLANGPTVVGPYAMGVVVAQEPTSLAPGPVTATGRALDVAPGPGVFLVVRTPAGTFYTRAGRLVVDARGALATDQGAVVLGTNGAPIQVGTTDGVAIAANGSVSVAGRVVGQIRLATLRAGTVIPAGNALYRLGPGTRAIPGGTLTPGALAQSNVDPARLLASLVTLVGQYQADEESAHTLAQTFQQFLTTGVAP